MSDPKQELIKAIDDITEVIASVSMPFPINNRLIVTRQKLIYENNARLNRHSYSIEASDITNVTASVGPVFGLIYLAHKSTDFPKQLGLFWRKDTIRMKRIIDGFVIAMRHNINIHDITSSELIPLLTKLGTDDPSVKG